MNQREIELVRIGFLKGIDCMEKHPENDDYDAIYFERALEQAESLTGESFDELEAVNNKLIESLNNIAHPISFLQKEAEKGGASLDGGMSIAITGDPSFYRNIAEKALQL